MIVFAIDFALGRDISNYKNGFFGSYKLNNKIAVSLMIAVRPGKIGSYDGFDKLLELPYVVTVSIKKKKGDVIPNSGSVAQRFAEVALLEERDINSLTADIRNVYSLITVKDTTGEDMVVSRFNDYRLSKII